MFLRGLEGTPVRSRFRFFNSKQQRLECTPVAFASGLLPRSRAKPKSFYSQIPLFLRQECSQRKMSFLVTVACTTIHALPVSHASAQTIDSDHGSSCANHPNAKLCWAYGTHAVLQYPGVTQIQVAQPVVWQPQNSSLQRVPELHLWSTTANFYVN